MYISVLVRSGWNVDARQAPGRLSRKINRFSRRQSEARERYVSQLERSEITTQNGHSSDHFAHGLKVDDATSDNGSGRNYYSIECPDRLYRFGVEDFAHAI